MSHSGSGRTLSLSIFYITIMHSCKIADKTPQQVYLSGTQCNFGVIGFVQCSQLLKYALHVICETWLTTTEVILQSAKHTHDVLVAIFYST